MRLRYPLLAVLILFGSDRAARGDPVVFTDRTSFLEASGPVATETFENDTMTAGCDSGGVVAIDLGTLAATANIPALKVEDAPCFGNHNTTPDGRMYLGADTDLDGVSADVMFVFPRSITSLGLFLTDLDLATLEVTINGVAYPVLPNGEGGQSYFGIVNAEPFTTVTFVAVTGFDAHYGFDDVAYSVEGTVSAGEAESLPWSRVKSLYRQ